MSAMIYYIAAPQPEPLIPSYQCDLLFDSMALQMAWLRCWLQLFWVL